MPWGLFVLYYNLDHSTDSPSSGWGSGKPERQSCSHALMCEFKRHKRAQNDHPRLPVSLILAVTYDMTPRILIGCASSYSQ